MSERYEIRPGSSKPGDSRYATHGEVLLALKATAKDLGIVARLPAGRHGDRWKASIDGLTVTGDTKRSDDHALETFCVVGPGVNTKTLMLFAEHIAAIAGKQAVIGETDDEFWFVEKPKGKSKKKKGEALMTRTLIKDGTVVTASDTFASDVWIENGKIAALVAPGTKLGEADQTIDAKGRYVIPGGIDAHTHMELPFGGTTASDDFDTGTVAAAHGGTTTILDFAIQSKGGSMKAGLDAWHAKAEGKAAIDYGFHLIMTEANPQTLEEMVSCIREGVTSFKMFMAYPGVFLVDDQQIFRAMLKAGELGGLITMHAEIGLPIDVLVQRALSEGHTAPVYHALTRPEVAEATGTERAIALAEMAKVPVYMVHLSAQRALERVMEARDRGLPAYAETCPQYLFCSEDDLRGDPGNEWKGAGYVCTPPLRPAHHHEHLWRGLRNYDLQTVATDHCPFCMKDQKELGRGDFSKIPNGMPGVETRLHLLWEGVTQGKISMNRFVEITSTAPAKIFGLYGKKGTLAVGADADVVVWDPKREKVLGKDTLHMRVDYSPFEGHKVPGSPSAVLSRGELIVENDQWVGKKKQGRGQFIRRGTFGL